MTAPEAHPIILFDGVCNLCNAAVGWIIRHDRRDRFRFASLQSGFARHTLATLPSPAPDSIALVINDKHDIHHVRERGYVEAPVRVASILKQIEPTGWFHRVAARPYPDSHLLAVHDPDYVHYLKTVCEATPPDRSV